ncbi:MAG TPA: alpha-amylase family glycosyl hydrolase [Nitrolancea sp.]|nr:alpha-amylase family glycosyl hydrolase [Nitrolancea sp.]
MSGERQDYRWWQTGIIYQIYPRSYQDSDGDGIGDLPGITCRLDYLQWLGVDALWLSPIFPSPMADFGYDVADYTAIDPIFGSMADFDRLLAEAHQRGLKVILDYVPNHTSSQHPWFLESRAARDSPKRDWYLWRDPAPGGGPPNNWLSVFGGGAWEWDEPTGQYYYHAFLKEQPDLNWRNPEVRRAMFDVLRFWLDKGVDGFRIDVIWHLIKDDRFRDNPANPHAVPGYEYSELVPVFTSDQPEVFEVIGAMRRVFDEYDDRVMIGEIYLPPERLVTYYGARGDLVQLPYNFQLILLPWDARELAVAIDEYEALLPEGAWPNWVLGNHDRQRIASRVGPEQARVAAMLLLTLRGTPTIYYGDEIGMHDVPILPEQVRDPHELREPGIGAGRDPERTPMQWDGKPNAGFTSGTPWLPLAEDAGQLNVEIEREERHSMLALQRELIELRRRAPALVTGGYTPVPASDDLLA